MEAMNVAEVITETSAEGVNFRLGEGWILLKTCSSTSGPVFVMAKGTRTATATWTYGRSVQLAPYQNFKVSITKEFPSDVPPDEAGKLLYVEVEATIDRIEQSLYEEGRVKR